ncbi:hypothetical protein NDU88_003709 [Pleurodeles waltl]|uniref:Uncharacterized protein n=1 Tax=Pleurodeles waltl TaxID=8319 RepID=A0AAV7T6V6_PLEWA|nr:hypothetical protein NDU88_003709 [Pleurodeles waltl]
MSSPAVTPSPSSIDAPADTHSDTAMESILQEIDQVSHRLEAMDSKITDLSADSNLIRADIGGFQDKVTDLDHDLNVVEDRTAALPYNEPELQFLRDKLTDLEDRSRGTMSVFLVNRKTGRAQI